MISLKIVLIILFAHFIGDFIFQTDWQAKNKSTNMEALTNHIITYTCTFLPIALFLGTLGIIFLILVFGLHWITDYFTSKLNSKLWEDKKVHWFFVSIGFDQFLHFCQLLLIYYFLTK